MPVYAGTEHFTYLQSLKPQATLHGRYYYNLLFTDEKTEAHGLSNVQFHHLVSTGGVKL